HIIAGLDAKDGKVAVEGWSKLTGHDVVDLAKKYEDFGIEALVYTDIGRDGMLSGVNIDATLRLAQATKTPIIASGGLSSVEDVRRLLNAGADKVSINTAAVQDPALVSQASGIVGAQCIVVAIDAKRNGSGWEVFTHGGRRATGLDAVQWAKRMVDTGAGEIL